MEHRKTPEIEMRIVNGIELDDGVDEPEDLRPDEPDTCRECGAWMPGCGYGPLCDACVSESLHNDAIHATLPADNGPPSTQDNHAG